MAGGTTLGPYRFTARQVAPIRRKNQRTAALQQKRATARKYPTQPGVQKYLPPAPKTNKVGQRLSPQRRQTVRERNLIQVELGRRKLAERIAGAPANQGPPTQSNRSDLHHLIVLARRAYSGEPHTAAAMGVASVPGLNTLVDAIGTGAISAAKELRSLANLSRAEGSSPYLGTEPDVPGAKTARKLLANALADAFELPENAVTSTYLTGDAIVKDLMHGPMDVHKDNHVTALFKSFAASDPVALAIQGKFKQAGQAAQEHPLNTALELSGIKSAIGRGAGVALRSGPPALRHIGSQERTPVRIYGHLQHNREYSKDIFNKALQVIADKRARSEPSPLPAGRLARRLTEARNLGKHGALGRAPGLTNFTGARGLANRVNNENVSLIEGLRRSHRQELIHQYLSGQKGTLSEGVVSKVPSFAAVRTPSAAEGIAGYAIERRVNPKTWRADLTRIRKQFIAARDRMKAEDNPNLLKLDANKQSIARIDAALKSGLPKNFFKQIDAQIVAHAPGQQALADRGLLSPAAHDMAKLVPYAADLMSARTIRVPIDRGNITMQPHSLHYKNGVLEGLDIRIPVRKQLTDGIHIPPNVTKIHLPHGRDAGARGTHRLSQQEVAALTKALTNQRFKATSHSRGTTFERNMQPGAGRAAVEQAGKRGVTEPALVTPEGKILTAQDIRDHMAANGIKEPGFFQQKIVATGPGSYYVNRWPGRGGISKRMRTHAASISGTYDASWEAAAHSHLRTTGLLDWSKGFDRHMATFGIRMPDGNLLMGEASHLKELITTREFRKYADANGLPKDLTVVRVAPHRSNADLKQTIHDHILGDGQHGPTALSDDPTHIADMLAAAKASGPGPAVIIPTHIFQQLEKHYERASGTQRLMQGANSLMKGAVLTTSSHWPTGNAIDLAIRNVVNGVGPRDWFLGRRYRSIAGEEQNVKVGVGAHFGTQTRMQTYRSADSFENLFGRVSHALRTTPGPGTLARSWQLYKAAIFHLNAAMEKQFTDAALGRVVRQEIRRASGRWIDGLRVQTQAVVDLANGHRNTAAQIEFARKYRQNIGNWDTYGPETRKILFDYMTFGSWAKNASQFIFLTLPVHHPILTGLIVASENLTAKEREQFGLNPRAANARPGWMQGSLPTSKGLIPFQGYTSFGFASDPLSNSASMLGGPFGSSIKALAGVDWKGDRLVNTDGTALTTTQKAAMSVYLAAQVMTPLASIGQRFLERGSPAGNSTIFAPRVKPRSKRLNVYQEALKIFNPFNPIPNTKTAASARTSDVPNLSTTAGSSGNIPDLSRPAAGNTSIPDLSGLNK